jgi:hypothetical protein
MGTGFFADVRAIEGGPFSENAYWAIILISQISWLPMFGEVALGRLE